MPHTAAELDSSRAGQLDPLVGDADGIVTVDPAMMAVLRTVRQIAPTGSPVLIRGESGTGKELIARALHRASNRSAGAFLVLDCAATPTPLIVAELIAAARRGTLFLDNIGDLPADLQRMLMRVLEAGEFTRVGSTQPETADIRFIAATTRDLEREVEDGRFASDLFSRLSSATVKLPPLRERPHDIYLLAPYFLRSYAARFGREVPTLDLTALIALTKYGFPGNVRELEDEMARLVAVAGPGAALGPEMLSEHMRAQPPSPANGELSVVRSQTAD